MPISASLVKELRERTGAGMMECKKALVTTDGDIEAAIELMRKSGQAKADKKAGRVAAEGLIVVLRSDDCKSAVMLEINCETDFVARDSHFVDFANQITKLALDNQINTIEQLNTSTCQIGTSETVEEARQHIVSKLGENIRIRRLAFVKTTGHIGSYLHGGRIGVLVSIDQSNDELAKDLSMHVAASNPVVLTPGDVSEELLAKEKEIFEAQAAASGKPAEIIEKMVSGRLEKYANEISLLGQPFVKAPSKSVKQLLEENKTQVESFVRFEVGEGIEKEEKDFASEVMAQIKG